MSTTTPRYGLPFIWPSWVTGLLSGDKQCAFAPWYRAHYQYAKRPDPSFNSAVWSADHNTLVLKRKAELEAEGRHVTLEAENSFKWKGQTALVSGKPDLISVAPDGALVSDCKTGKPRNSDVWQVLLYMAALAVKRPDLSPLSGELVYSDHIEPIGRDGLTLDRKERIFAVFRLVGGDARPDAVPSEMECRFCDLADCTDRFVEVPVDEATEPVEANF